MPFDVRFYALLYEAITQHVISPLLEADPAGEVSFSESTSSRIGTFIVSPSGLKNKMVLYIYKITLRV